MPAWTATWAINEAPGRCEVIRDGRPVGIERCDGFEQAVDMILHHRLYETRDHIVRRRRGQEHEVDLGVF